ncbi:MAG TPA: pseudouridine synthase [Terriglobia bacterium]|nr:pseudouridine synthase [Terriglobia bacterium]
MKTKEAMTLDRVLSRMGVTSRSSAKEAILAGRLKVNGRVVRDPECWVRPGRDFIQFDGNAVKRVRKIYLLFYKPKGVITSHGDPSGRKTVYDILKNGNNPTAPNEDFCWVAPVGRLDKDTSGLLLMTNDTEFADFVTSPESQVTKTYLVKTSGLLSDEIIARLEDGVEMKRGDQARPISVRRTEDRGKYTWLEIVLTEGKNREVRRMIEAVGFKVLKLVRTQIGSLTLEGLEVGKWRGLTSRELVAIRSSKGNA